MISQLNVRSWPFFAASLALLSGTSSAQDRALLDAPQFQVPHLVTDVAVADFTGDHIADIAYGQLIQPSGTGLVLVARGRGDGTFESAVGAPSIYTSGAIASADFNGDGRPDLASVYSNYVVVALNLGNGVFGQPAYYGGSMGARELVCADFNGDHAIDIATARADGFVTISLNTGTGTFSPAPSSTLSAASSCARLAQGDLDGDGDIDLAVLDSSLNRVVMLTGNGSGSFVVGPALSLAAPASELVVADLDADGRADLALIYATLDRLTTWRSAGGGAFTLLATLTTGDQPSALAVGDWNLDGHLDLATSDLLGRQFTVVLDAGSSTPLQLAQRSATAATLLRTGDFDADGRDDLLTMTSTVSEPLSTHRGRGDGTFASPAEFGLSDAQGLAVADLDGDGDLDLAVAETNPGALTVLVGSGSGSFQIGTAQGVSQGPKGVALGYLDGDALLDAVTSNPSTSSVSVLRGTGNASFGAPTSYALPNSSNRPLIADLDGDGHRDVALALISSTTLLEQVAWLPGDGNGGLGAAQVLQMGAPEFALAIGDLDGDTRPDVITAGCDSVGAGYVSVRLNQGGGSFASAAVYPGARWLMDLTLGDMDGDGDLDAVVVGDFHKNVSVYHNLGNGTFAIPADKFEMAANVTRPQLVDFDGDGDLDLVTANGNESVFVALNDSTGMLSEAGVYATSGYALDVAVGDFDSDGDPDVVTAGPNYQLGSSFVSLLSNQTRTQPSLYCSAKVNSLGCTPAISYSGQPSASSPQPFMLTASNLLNQKAGMLFYGFGASATPYLGGTFCVAVPVQRTGVQNSGGSASGSDCSGTFALDFNARIQSGLDPALTAGERVFAQHYSRDPGASSHAGFTNAVEFRIAP